jgi:hypothetical protein
MQIWLFIIMMIQGFLMTYSILWLAIGLELDIWVLAFLTVIAGFSVYLYVKWIKETHK